MAIPIAALEKDLEARLDQAFTLHWFKNDFTPDINSEVADFVEADFSGYASKAITSANWEITPGNPCIAEYPVQTVTADANGQDQTVYGIYVTYDDDNTLAWYERFPTPRYIDVNGDSSSFLLRRTEGNGSG